jgi:drug/metabolite transporter (DMT)-like permease
MGLAASWTISSVMVNLGISKLEKSKDMTTRWYVKHVVPIGGFAAFSLALGNYTYLYLSVSFIQMLKAAVPCVTMLVLVGANLEKPHRVTVLGVAILTFGTALAAYGEISFKWIGVVMMFSSEFSEACRMAVLQYLLGNLRFELIEGLYVMSPASFGFLAVGIYAFEWEAIRLENGLGKILDAPHKYACAAFLGFLVNLLTLAVIKSTSSLTFKVMGQVKNTLVILVSVILFGSAVTGVQVVGYAISMVGFAVYQRGKQIQAKDDSVVEQRVREKGKGVGDTTHDHAVQV